MKFGQLEVLVEDLFALGVGVAESRPKEGSSLGAREMHWHDGLISVDRHQLILLAVDINRGVVCAVSDLIEDSRLERLVRVVVAHLRGVVVAIERRMLALADRLDGFLALVEQHLQDWLEDLSEPVFWRLGQLSGVVDVLVDAVVARHAVFT